MAYIAHQWAQFNNWQMGALTVDHGLRQESFAEACQVNQWMMERGIPHQTLIWAPPQNLKNIQDQARIARHNLLHKWCQSQDVPYLLLGHTQDDQYETIVMRLCHHSGALGLAGIPAKRVHQNVSILRPLFGVSKQKILQYMSSRGLPWIEDPSNQKDIYTRVRIRNTKSSLEGSGLYKKTVLALGRKVGALRQAEEEKALAWCKTYVKVYQEGYLCLAFQPFLALSVLSQEIVFSSLLKLISGDIYNPEYGTLERSLARIRGGAFKPFTCHGCLIDLKKLDVFIYREERQIPDLPLEGDQTLHWDNRFLIEFEGGPKKSELTLRSLRGDWVELKKTTGIKSLPYPVRRTIPSIWQKEKLILVPHLDYVNKKTKCMRWKVRFLPTLEFFHSRFIID